MQLNHTVFDKFPVLTSKRLTLREIQQTDADRIFAMRASGRTNQFIARENMTDKEDALGLVNKTRLAFENKQAIGWAGLLREENEIIGTCGFNSIDFANLRAEIGGELWVEYWGKHIALEAVEAIVHFGLHTLNLHSIEAKVSPGNRGAIHLLEHLGFKKEAHFHDRIFFKDTFLDMAIYTLIKKNP